MESKRTTKLQDDLALALNCDPDDGKVTNVIEVHAQWFEFLLQNIGVEPASIPTLLRWQYLHTEWHDSLQ